MKSVKSIVDQLTNIQRIMTSLKTTLKEIDPNYAHEEQKYLQAVTALANIIGDNNASMVGEYIEALEQEVVSNMIYAGWLGFQLNQDCFRNPLNKQFLHVDYEEVLREDRMYTLPATQAAQSRIENFRKSLTEEESELTDVITSYFCYLQTIGYKLAHYHGFRVADEFLYWVIPGYVSDLVTTRKYGDDLFEFLAIGLQQQ